MAVSRGVRGFGNSLLDLWLRCEKAAEDSRGLLDRDRAWCRVSLSATLHNRVEVEAEICLDCTFFDLSGLVICYDSDTWK